ncbi:MAG TPA: hypothetical protein D7H79_01645 [Candidatus Poseidoniales archaeon]|jgi:rubredoxin|nr:MAG TPA: hypothetical protein D7H79_01645 [Candidatus Poseidoniales archaeon]|tara:strand:- start:5555 stop:6055 length:501 start_codon:yes stop_codon:yes gene_type:complete
MTRPLSGRLDRGVKPRSNRGFQMSRLTAMQLQQLIGLPEYEQNLAIDRLSRELGIPSDEIRTEIELLDEGISSKQISSPSIPVPQKKSRFNFRRKETESLDGGPNFIDDSSKFRFGYDPSHDGKKRQEQVNQAIVCPNCSSPLGIPDIRPIKVICPSCGAENTYEN